MALIMTPTPSLPQRRRPVAIRALPAAAAAAAPPALQLPALLQSLGLLALCCAGAVFLVASVPALFVVARMAHRAESLLKVRPHTMFTRPDTKLLCALAVFPFQLVLFSLSGAQAACLSCGRCSLRLHPGTNQNLAVVAVARSRGPRHGGIRPVERCAAVAHL
jgi:hypothetical protein